MTDDQEAIPDDESDVTCYQCGREYSKSDLYQAMVSGECPGCGHRYPKPR